MTLCGWKIFSKNKQRTKRSNNEVNETVTLSSLLVPSQSEVVLPNVPLSRRKAKFTFDNDTNRKIKENGNKKSDLEDQEKDADGNPRNKCALKPGHSLMDWIRLGSSGCDLAGTKGVIKQVSNSELKLHCKKDDAWLVIRGKAYNVTHYMDFHPGGPDELMKGVGKDATEMFDEVHAWVNYEQLLSKCYIGPLQNIVKVDLESNRTHQKTSSANGSSIKPMIPSLLTATTSAKTSPTKSSMKNINDLSLPVDIIPRFDWIQRTSDITLIFYTKSFCNPGLIVSRESDYDFDIKIIIERNIHQWNFKLLQDVKWPCFIKLNCETGKIEINFLKNKSELWTNYGKMDRQNFDNIEDLSIDCEVVENQQINHDSFAICLKPCCKTIMVTPIGFHVSATALVNGNYITRSYTPVPARYLPIDRLDTFIPFLIKSYATGTFAKYVTSLSVNKTSSNNIVTLSQPKGNFILKKLLNHCRIGLLAAGSGITPMLSVLDHLLGRSTNRIENIQLLFFNKSEKDIWCRHQLESITVDKRLVVRHILSEPEKSWKGEIGRISKDLISSLSDPKSDSQVTYCCVCGPTPFNELSQEILKDIGFEAKNLHFFQG